MSTPSKYVHFTLKGVPGAATLFKTARPDKSLRPRWLIRITYQGDRFMAGQSGQTESLTTAREYAAAELRAIHAEGVNAWVAASDSLRRKKQYATVGEIYDRIIAGENRKSAKDQRRMGNELLNVVAWAMDLWAPATGQGRHRGDRMADRAAIFGMSATIFASELARRYLLARLQSVGSPALDAEGNIDRRMEHPSHTTIFKSFHHATDALKGKNLHRLYGGLKLPDFGSFVNAALVKMPEAKCEPLTPDQYTKMVNAAAAMEASADAQEQALGLLNRILRQTGLRSGTAARIAGNWIQQVNSGWSLKIPLGDGIKTAYPVPITDELAADLRERSSGPELVFPDGATLVRSHNSWLKSLLGLTSNQGNHRLRDTAATIVRSLHGLQIASLFLGHHNLATTAKSYADEIQTTPEMDHDLRAASRLVPGNIVRMEKIA